MYCVVSSVTGWREMAAERRVGCTALIGSDGCRSMGRQWCNVNVGSGSYGRVRRDMIGAIKCCCCASWVVVGVR